MNYCVINLHIKWSTNCLLVAGTGANEVRRFTINVTKRYGPVVILLAQDKVKLLKQLESNFERTFN